MESFFVRFKETNFKRFLDRSIKKRILQDSNLETSKSVEESSEGSVWSGVEAVAAAGVCASQTAVCATFLPRAVRHLADPPDGHLAGPHWPALLLQILRAHPLLPLLDAPSMAMSQVNPKP
jgi:hypothetical protein